MEQITLRVPEDTLRDIDEYTDEHDVTRSEYIRDALETRRDMDDVRMGYLRDMAELQREYEERIDDLEGDLKDQENRMEDLRNQLSAANTRDEEHTELVTHVKEERSYRRASILTRAKWWLTGMPEDEE